MTEKKIRCNLSSWKSLNSDETTGNGYMTEHARLSGFVFLMVDFVLLMS